MSYDYPEHMQLGYVAAAMCGKQPKWPECWCDKDARDGGCRFCQTYQLMYGLDPTCGDSGKPEKYYFSMGRTHKRTDEEVAKLRKLQIKMRKGEEKRKKAEEIKRKLMTKEQKERPPKRKPMKGKLVMPKLRKK